MTFPATPTATLAVVDDGGNLASLAVLAVRPGDDDDAGAGGTVVPVPISADSSGGFGDERTPLNETVALFGPESLDDEVPLLLGVGIDELFVVDEDELAELLAPSAPSKSTCPHPVRTPRAADRRRGTADADARRGRRRAQRRRSDGGRCRPLPDRRRRVAGDRRRGRRRVGDPAHLAGGPVGEQPAGRQPAPIDVLGRVTSGPIAVQPLRSTPIVSLDRNPRGVDAAALDRAEVLVIFGHIAPSKVAAPNPGYNFRLVSSFSDDQLAGDATRLDVAYTATEALLDADANVISVDTSAGEAASRRR